MSWLGLAFGLTVLAGSITGAYFLWLFGASKRNTVISSESVVGRRDPVLIVVPVYNERDLIGRKLENLAAIAYPDDKRRTVIVDGGSIDGTLQTVRQWIRARPGFDLMQTVHRNKTAQIAEALRFSTDEDWILVTDADAILSADTLNHLMDAASSPSVGVVGTRVRPVAAHPLESLHWQVTNWLRHREERCGSAGIVAAPCYLARRRFVADLPADVVADDVHVACRAMVAGHRVGHADVTVLELRAPREVCALLRHKCRKVNAYLREVFRFLPLARKMRPPMRGIFLSRAMLLTAVPLLLTISSCAAVVGAIRGEVDVAAPETLVCGLALMMLLATTAPRGPVRFAALATAIVAVSTAALLAFPFWRQTSSFPKIVSGLEPDEAG